MAKKDVIKDNKKNNFGKDLKSELKKVTWPSVKQLVNNTYAVVAIVLIVAVIVFILDVCFENLNKFSVDKLKSIVSTNTEETVENGTEENVENSDAEPSADVENDATATPSEVVDASSTTEPASTESDAQGAEVPEENVNQ